MRGPDFCCYVVSVSPSLDNGVFCCSVFLIISSELQNVEAITRFLTDDGVEADVRKRVEDKALAYGREIVLVKKVKPNFRISPLLVGELYVKWVMPLTKEVQMEYLLHRLDAEERLKAQLI